MQHKKGQVFNLDTHQLETIQILPIQNGNTSSITELNLNKLPKNKQIIIFEEDTCNN